MSSASEDIKLIKVEERFGLVGYAAYWKIIEYCSRQWKPKTEPVFEITKKHLNNILRMKSKQSQIILGLFSELNLFEITECDNAFIINFPKLLLIKDEHSSKELRSSGVTPDKVPLETDTELELDINIKTNTVKHPQQNVVTTTNEHPKKESVCLSDFDKEFGRLDQRDVTALRNFYGNDFVDVFKMAKEIFKLPAKRIERPYPYLKTIFASAKSKIQNKNEEIALQEHYKTKKESNKAAQEFKKLNPDETNKQLSNIISMIACGV